EKETYQTWLKGNTTGAARIRASVPSDWVVGDKTGSCGAYGTANDYAVVWPKNRAPLIISVYTTKNEKEAKHEDKVIAEASRIAIDNLK
ncbi:serine hydrolase, partial [Enterobacter roggenkampii]